MGKDNFNPGPRLSEKEIERLVGDMYAEGKSPMEVFGIDWATTRDLSAKVEVAEGKILSAQTLPREVDMIDKDKKLNRVELYLRLEDGSKVKIMPCDLEDVHIYRPGDGKNADLPEA